MKNKSYLSLFLIPVLLLAGCGGSSTPTPTPTPSPVSTNTNVVVTPVVPTVSSLELTLIQTGATVATGSVLNLAVTQTSTRTKLANQIYAAASALYQLSGGQMLTPAQFNTLLASYGIDGVSQYTQFTTAIDALYASYYAKYTSGSVGAQNISAIVAALAQGAEAGASTYETITTTTPPVASN